MFIHSIKQCLHSILFFNLFKMYMLSSILVWSMQVCCNLRKQSSLDNINTIRFICLDVLVVHHFPVVHASMFRLSKMMFIRQCSSIDFRCTCCHPFSCGPCKYVYILSNYVNIRIYILFVLF